jgi:DNA-binding HxlR family transcriptional regulator
MARTHKKVRYSPKSKGKEYTPAAAAQDVERAFKVVEGRWKLLILFHLFGGKVLRFSELERAIPAISQKMLIQQLRQMENDGMVRRIVHHQVPPKVEYGLTDWGQALCPALDALLKWAALREKTAEGIATTTSKAILMTTLRAKPQPE